ncbi:F-box protein At5g03100-like [Triticum dicoccoides]|uniref:F-box protein At5g03100-like n=1 Tax=Triticum dicoccoides TaxID=85692 RepID=UPI00189118EB|nr:F-box protein At5g03100-like [Triticum dicoccoides]
MEMEPDGSSSKKANPLSGPWQSRSESSNRRPDEDDGRVDRISNLPDPILGEIVSLLRTKEAARTQILASRWRHIWRSAPLNLDCRRLPDEEHGLAGVASRIISAHPGPGRRFRIPAYYLQDRAGTVDAWLRSPALDKLQELEFCHVSNYRPRLLRPLAPPPASTFRFSPTLRVVTIGRCLLPDSTVQGLHLPQLKQLALERVSISEGTLCSLIARCPALECLLIYYSFGFRCARINSHSLISIGVRLRHRYLSDHETDEPQFRELIIENAPSLERLLRVDILDGLHVSITSAPKLETLGSLHGEMYLSSSILQRLPSDSHTTVVGAVKFLYVRITCLDIGTTLQLLRCFPCLEKLYIQQSISGDLNLWKRKHRDLIKCLDLRLKKVVMQYYRGIRAQVNFATFFILNAKMLELMSFKVDAEYYCRAFLANSARSFSWRNGLQEVLGFTFKLIDFSAVIR